ncbi:hypothetical protein F3Y22_tig00110637pilonHSYRG00193 [Hibiscus syriacus]|uniref:GDSL esterase/lipase n=1 Tax=Hibiscus syriacus TaxID=106335 RepID=A0A6A2ZYV6_HIBSY|nr:hypothetical protein F3Y22_tig00110637pilonHSYRG00193 [Hibiscus syriacus]
MGQQWLVFPVVAIVLVLEALVSAGANASMVTFVYGDSLAEVGNNNHLQYSLARSDYPWNGIGFTGRKATRRFTNGLNDMTKESIREAAANKLCNEATYFVGIGSNDYVNNFLQPFLADGQQYTHDEFVELLTSTLDQQFSMTFADTYPAVLDLISNPKAYGFKFANTSCCNVDTSIGGLCLPNSKLCKERKDYVFWDAIHPSDAANEVLAQKLFDSLSASAMAPSLPLEPH